MNINMIIRKVLLSFLLMFLTSFYFFGHSGRTDRYGGHYNRKTGEYHNHNSGEHSSPIIWLVLLGAIIIGVIIKAGGDSNKKN